MNSDRQNLNVIRLAKPVETTIVFNVIEKKYSIHIPEDIKSILKHYSRGVPVEKEFMIDGQNFMLSCFLSANDRDKINLATVTDRLHDYLNDIIFIPFATDGLGNYYGMIFNGGDVDNVFFYNSEQGSMTFVCALVQQVITALGLE